MNPSVTILTATYNQEHFIRECVESVLCQTYPYWNLYILDDGSTDRTVDIANEYAKDDQRIIVQSFKHMGLTKLADRYNWALQMSRDEYVAILDGDDYWPCEKLERQVAFHCQIDAAITFGNATIVSDKSPREGFIKRNKPFIKSLQPEMLYTKFVEHKVSLPAVSVMVRQQKLKEIGGFQQVPYLYLCDYTTWLHLGMFGMAYLDAPLGYWRQSAGQTTWIQAHSLSVGMFRYTEEFIKTHHIQARILTAERVRFMADASYRKAVVLWKEGMYWDSRQTIKEIFRFRTWQNVDLLIKFFLMAGWNFFKSHFG